MKLRYAKAHMQAARVYSNLSFCKRRRVGCVIVHGDSIISMGWNGTPPGEDNCCEDHHGNTKPTVRHAEDNAIRKLIPLLSAHIDKQHLTLFVTTSPCILCAKKIVQAGIPSVVYCDNYRISDGLQYLRSNGVRISRLKSQSIFSQLVTRIKTIIKSIRN